MKILIIHTANYVKKHDQRDGIVYFTFPTLLHGNQLFDQQQIINNVQTRESIKQLGNKVIFYFHTDRERTDKLIKSSIMIRKLCKEHKPDLTHIYWGGVSGLLAIIFSPGKTIVSLLGSDLFGSYNSNGNKTIQSWLQTFSSRLAVIISSGAIVMSKRMKEYLWNSKSNWVTVIPEGINKKLFSPIDINKARKYLKWDQDKFIIIFFYNGEYVKNYELAKKSINLFKLKCANFEFKIINGIEHGELVYTYNAADCMLITSFHEGSNNSIKEAMACNLPIISVQCGDAEERLELLENCYVTPYDAEHISEALEKIYVKNVRLDGKNYLENISLELCANKVLSFYEQVINK